MSTEIIYSQTDLDIAILKEQHSFTATSITEIKSRLDTLLNTMIYLNLGIYIVVILSPYIARLTGH